MEQQIRKLIVEDNVDTFCLKGNGWFDIYASGVLKRLKKEYPDIHIVFIIASVRQLHCDEYNFFDSFDFPAGIEAAPYKLTIPVRDYYIVKNADYIVSYVYKEYGEAYEAIILAKKYNKIIINLAD